MLATDEGLLLTFWPGERSDPHRVEIHVVRPGGGDLRVVELDAHDLRSPVRVAMSAGWLEEACEVRVTLNGMLGAHLRLEPSNGIV
jgi:hypothetical protein